MKRRHRKTLDKIYKIIMPILIVTMAFTMTGFAYANSVTAMAAVEPTSPAESEEAIVNETVPETVPETIPEATVPETTVPEIEPEVTEAAETEPITTESTEPDVPAETNPPQEENEHTNSGCNHFWRREYEPETETEAGYLIDSCLHCGEWKIVEVIPPYGA